MDFYREAIHCVSTFQKNRIAFPSAGTTALVMQSLGQAPCNMLAISNPLHAWEVGMECPSPPPESLLHEHNNASDHQE